MFHTDLAYILRISEIYTQKLTKKSWWELFHHFLRIAPLKLPDYLLPRVKSEADLERGGGRHALSLFFAITCKQASNVSISLASSKSWISPLKAFENMISSSNFYNMEKWTKFENASMRQKLICQKKVSNVIMAFQTIWNLELSSSANHGKNLLIHPWNDIPSFLKFFALLFIYWPNPQHFLGCSVENVYVTLILTDHCFA